MCKWPIHQIRKEYFSNWILSDDLEEPEDQCIDTKRMGQPENNTEKINAAIDERQSPL